MLKVKICELEQNYERWQVFLEKNKPLIFHTPQYKKFIEEAFGCKYRIFAAIENEEIKTILPLVEVKSKLFGSKIISTAYLEYGGFAGEEKYVEGMIDFLAEKYKRNYHYLEIRGGLEKFDNILSSKLIKKELYKRFVLELSDKGAVWKNIQKSKRKAIKRALNFVEVKEVTEDKLNDFYHLYCINMQAFGSPPYSKQYFKSFYKNIVAKGLGRIYGAYHQEKLVAALLGFHYGERVLVIIAVSDQKYQQYRPNDAVHWTFIQWACEKGYKYFDFGRVREDSGQFEYKRKWGPQLRELPSYFLLWKAKEIPVVDPSQHGSLVKLWRMMPLWFTQVVGMRLRKGLGI